MDRTGTLVDADLDLVVDGDTGRSKQYSYNYPRRFPKLHELNCGKGVSIGLELQQPIVIVHRMSLGLRRRLNCSS